MKYSTQIYTSIFNFKDVLQHITHTKEATVKFLQKQNILISSVQCPGPLIKGCWQGACCHQMTMKRTNDSRDSFVWRCRKIHTLQSNSLSYKVKDVKLSIQHYSWLVDTTIPLETIVKLIYLWSKGFTHAEVIHELKLSNKTVPEWFLFCHEACIYSVIDKSTLIRGNSIEVKMKANLVSVNITEATK